MKTLCGRDSCLGCIIKYSNDIDVCKRERDRAIARKNKTIPTPADCVMTDSNGNAEQLLRLVDMIIKEEVVK
mgnify:CR=1 FL=1